jgi:4-diphosphocytidyl-2-C-methyl-D-erythritol kinase
MRLSARAPAKVNRELRVGRLRPDGYHEIRSRMASIDLADRLTVEPSASLELTCDDPAVPLGEANLVTRAALLLSRQAGVVPRARFTWKSASRWAGLGAAVPMRRSLWFCSIVCGGSERMPRR